MDSLFKKATEGMTDLNKLQEMLMPLGANPADAKVQKWLADQMGVTPDRPITPGSSSTATSKRPASTSSASGGGWAEWMTKLSGEEHVTVFNRVTGKRLSGQDGPKLKNLAQWFIENDQYEVDPKWAEEMGEKFSRPSDAKRKGPGRPPLDDTPSRSGKTGSPGIGPSYNSMASLGIDPKNPISALAVLESQSPKNQTKDIFSGLNTIAPPAVNNTGIAAVNIAKVFANLPISRDYSLSHQIGKGTFSNVYLAEDSQKQTQLALKHLVPTSKPSRILMEAKCMKIAGGHPNVIQLVHGTGAPRGHL